MRKALILGISGQTGSYLAELLLSKDYVVHGVIRRSSSFNTGRINHIFDRLNLHYGDMTDGVGLSNIFNKVQPDECYNMAAQSHVKVSFECPEYTENVTALGATRLLEIIRQFKPDTKYYQASSSEMYGNSPPMQNEETPMIPNSPYSVAKLHAYLATKNYRDGYGIFASNGILFNHECLTQDTPIIIKENGLVDIVTIGSIVPHREDSSKGKKYTTDLCYRNLGIWDGDRWAKVKTATATWNDAKRDKYIRQVVCRGGYYEATSNHLSFKRGVLPVQTKDLKVGDELELKTFPPLMHSILTTEEEAEFIGMMVADGYISPDGGGRFVGLDDKLTNKIKVLWAKLRGGYYRCDIHPSGFENGKDIPSVELNGDCGYLRLLRDEIYEENGYKKIPKRILNADVDVIYAFLNGYNACDGLKGGHQITKFRSFTTNSSVLALGLWYLVYNLLGSRIIVNMEFRDNKKYYHLNVNSHRNKGGHLQRNISEIKEIRDINYVGWLCDLETDTGTFSAGVGKTWVHNSPRRGETFVTRKVTMAVAKIALRKQDKLLLGNMDAKRDWGFCPEYVEAMWEIMQLKRPDDIVIGTGETHTVEEFVNEAFNCVGLDWHNFVEIDKRYLRPTEVNVLQADTTKAQKLIGWKPKVKFKELVHLMVDADLKLAERE